MADTLATALTTELLGPDGDFDSWLDGWRQQGQTRAAAGTAVPDLMRESLESLAVLRQQALGDLLPGDAATARRVQEWDNLQAAAMTALISGYFTGQELLAETQRTALAELTALNRINSAANSTLDLDQMLDSVVDHVTAVTRADVCSLFTYEPEIDRLVLRATRGLSPTAVGRVRLRLGEGVTGWAARAGKPLALTDGWRDDRFLHVPGLGEERTRAILAVPIVLFTKLKLVGVITLQSYGDRQFAERDVSFLETVAGEVAIAIENARLHRETDERLRQKVAQLTILQGVSASIAATLNLQEVLAMLASEAVHLLGADAAVLYELREEWLIPTASFGFRPNEKILQRDRAAIEAPPLDTSLPLPPPLDAAESLLGRALIAGRPVVLDARSGDESDSGDLLTALDDPGQYLAGVGMDDAAPLRMGADFGGLPFATQLCVPLLAPRSIVGGLCVYSREARLFGEEAISLLLAFAREGAIAIENAHLYEEARHGMEMQTLLLREMHHRVRNNLQRTASLLRMQANRMPDGPARHALQESVIRIQSIARVHDLLSHEQVGLTDISAVTGLVCEVVQNTLGRPDLYVSISTDHDPDLLLSSREAFPLTLLLTECLSNSLLHGFAGREIGIIQIAAHLTDDSNAILLTVTDNGVGLRPGFDPERDSHLGLEVIRRLGEQELGGRIRIGPNPDGPGTRTVFRFPYQRPTGPTPTEADREMALKGIR